MVLPEGKIVFLFPLFYLFCLEDAILQLRFLFTWILEVCCLNIPSLYQSLGVKKRVNRKRSLLLPNHISLVSSRKKNGKRNEGRWANTGLSEGCVCSSKLIRFLVYSSCDRVTGVGELVNMFIWTQIQVFRSSSHRRHEVLSHASVLRMWAVEAEFQLAFSLSICLGLQPIG